MSIKYAETEQATGTTKYVGQAIDRVDGPAKTTGEARFAAEYPYPGLAYAALVHATVPRGRITAIDTAQAKAVRGVIDVLTHENAPPMKPAPKLSLLDPSTLVSGTPVNYLATDEVHWNGQPVAVVVAETPETARYAASLVRPAYEELPATVDLAAEQHNAVPQKGNLLGETSADKGDAQAALAAAPHSVDLTFTTPPHNHNAIEPHATTAVWEGDRLTVHEATQNITWTRKHLAQRFGVPEKGVRVLSPYVGGGFGGKGSVWAGTLLAVLAARATGRPVRLALTREAVYHTVGGRTGSIQRVALGAGADGALTAILHTSVSRTGRGGGHGEQITAGTRHLYAAPNIHLRQSTVPLDLLPNTFMRAPGESIGTFALESAVDELALELGLDPVELRLRNEPDRDPVGGQRLAHRRLREAYALGAERFGWRERDPAPCGTAGGWSAWGWPRPTTRRCGCRRTSRCAWAPTARSWCAAACRRWAWARRRCWGRWPPTSWACRWRPYASSTATPTCRSGPAPAARCRPRAPRRACRTPPPSSSAPCSAWSAARPARRCVAAGRLRWRRATAGCTPGPPARRTWRS
jgi:xanthine dehydrogenase YagR molybdenum-binding subunit